MKHLKLYEEYTSDNSDVNKEKNLSDEEIIKILKGETKPIVKPNIIVKDEDSCPCKDKGGKCKKCSNS